MTKLYYALKQQEKINRVPLNSNIKPPKYWVYVGLILLVTFLILICV